MKKENDSTHSGGMKIDFRVNGEKYPGERKEKESLLKNLSPVASLHLACLMGRELNNLIEFSEAMKKEKEKRINEEKRMFAHAEKDSIMGSLSLPVIDEKFFLDETDDLLDGGNQLGKNMNKINNTKKRRI